MHPWMLRGVAVLLAFVASAVFADDKKVEVLWLGHAAFKITTPGGKTVLIDPWLTTNPKAPAEYKNPDVLGKVDLILITHAHGDHFGADSVYLAKKHNAPVLANAGLVDSAVSLGMLPRELAPRFNKGGVFMPFGPGSVKVTQVHAEHASELTWKNPATDKVEMHIGGEPVGFIIELENGFRIYHTGDTMAFGDMKFIGDYYKPDLVLICIGDHFVMGPKQAAFVTREWIKPKYAIPMHYGTVPELRGTPEEYMKELGNAPVKVFPLKPGEKVAF